MISTAFYKLDVRDTQWDVAHLFEHLLINSWHVNVVQNQYSDALFGWTRGGTFEDYIFLDVAFYDGHVAELFDTFIHSKPSFTIAEIEKSLAEIGAEEKAEFIITDMIALRQVLEKLSHRLALGGFADNPSQENPILILSKKKASRYRDIALTVTGNGLSDVEQMLFLRIKVLLIDIISCAMSRSYASYGRGHSALVRRDESIAYMSKITLKRSQGTLARFTDNLRASIHDFPVEENWPQIAAHMKVYASEPLWRAVSIDYYRETGIIATPIEIANLATRENVQTLLSKVTVQAHPYSSTYDQWIN